MTAMAFRQKLVRCVALALLLRAGVDLLVGDFLEASTFDQTSTVGDPAPNDPEENPSSPGEEDDHGDDCFCCCTHVAISPIIELGLLEVTSFALLVADPAEPDTEPSRIFHPPRA